MFKGDPNQSVQELLDEIKGEAVRGSNNGNLNFLTPAVASLLVKLSDAADNRAKIIERWTKLIAGLTIVLIILTVPLAWDTLKSFVLLVWYALR